MHKLKISEDFDERSDLVLYPGDCLKLLETIPDKKIKLIITSPPYNIGKEYEKKTSLGQYIEFQKKVIKQCARILDENGSIVWQVGNFVDKGEVVPLDIVLYPIFASLGLKLRNRVVWQFGHGLHASKRFSGRYEVALWFTKSPNYTFNLDNVRVPQKYPQKKYFKGPKKGEYSGNPLGKNPGDVWDIPNVKANHIEKTIHPAQFPVELIERFVLALTNEGDWTFDPFMGSGTTQIASVLHQRRSAGAEILMKYFDVAMERVRMAEEGKLQIRPIERPVYDPTAKTSHVPPKTINLKDPASTLFRFIQNEEVVE